MTSLRGKLSYANVVATLALVLAVAGIPSAVAITANKVKKNAVGTKQLKNGSVTAAKLANGNVTASKLAGARVVTRTDPGLGSRVACQAPERLVAGGAKATGDAVTLSIPDSSDPNAWFAGVGLGGTSATAYAVCLKDSPGP